MSSTLCALQLESIAAELSGLQLKVHETGDLHVSQAIREHGVWEIYETQLISELLKPGDCFIDVGANIGYYSVIAANLVGENGRVIAFEPEQRNFDLLTANIGLLNNACQDRVTAVNAGLSNLNTQADIHLSADNYGDHQIYDGGKSRHIQTIELVAGSDYLAGLAGNIQRINVLKIDTQGAEMKVMSGLQAMIKKSLPEINIIIEFWPFGLRQAGDHGHQLLDFLLTLNLPMAIIDHIDHGLIPCQEADLRQWIDELDKDDKNEGFMNILVGSKLL